MLGFVSTLRMAFWTVLVALGLSLAGCDTPKAPEIKPLGSVTITVDPANRRTVARAPLANDVTFVLPPPDPAGSVWQISVHDSRFMRQRTEITPAADPAKGPTVTFLTIQTGVTRARFVLVPAAGQREVDPTDLKEVELTIR